MSTAQTMTLDEIERLAMSALLAAGASPEQAGPLAAAIMGAEADGIASHGLAYLPTYCEHLRCGKVDGKAVPVVTKPKPALVVVDAKSGASGAGRDAKADMMFAEVNESVKAYGVGGHRHVAEIEQEGGRAAELHRRRRSNLRPHPEEPRDARRLEGWTADKVLVPTLRDAAARPPQGEVFAFTQE